MATGALNSVDAVDSIARPTTVKELWEQYQQHLQATLDPSKALQEIRLTQTALVRYTLPGWGGPVPLAERLSPQEIDVALKFAETVSLSQFQTAPSVLEGVLQQVEANDQQPESKKGKEYFQNLRKRNRHYLTKFWDWVNEQGWFEPSAAQKPTASQYCFYEKKEGKVPIKSLRITNRRHTKRHTKSDPSDLAESGNKQERQQWTFALGKVDRDFVNPKLQSELEDFWSCMRDGRLGESVREVSADSSCEEVLLILGWFHRVEGVPLADLRLETLVPFVRLRPALEDTDSVEQWIIKSWSAGNKAKQLAAELEEKVRKHLSWRDSRIAGNPSLHPGSKVRTLNAWVAVAKYICRLETDQDESDDFDDIPAVRRLRKLSRELTKQSKITPNVVSHDVKMVPWLEFLGAVERLRVEAELERISDGNKRTDFAQAKSKQRFLLSSFLSIMPPDRQRTYRELVVGKTLVQGQLNGSQFTPKNRMADPENAKWYIHLEPSDYKTGDTYGSWWGEVPNVQYPDGKTFYGYIDEWLHQWRQVFAPSHHYFFTQPNGRPLTDSSLGSVIKHAFYRLLHVPVTPHVLRNMFITYLYDLQVPEHVLDSAALAMHHSRRMQANNYNRQEQFEKLRPSLDLATSFVQQIVNPQTGGY